MQTLQKINFRGYADSTESLTLTRSILAENSSYYKSGINLNYTSLNEKWLISVLFLNGWQRIFRPPGNQSPAFGHQLQYKLSKNIILNSSSFIGTVYGFTRYFHNLYGIFKISKVNLIAGFDLGLEQAAPESHTYNVWNSPVLIFKYKFSNRYSLAGRGRALFRQEQCYDRCQ